MGLHLSSRDQTVLGEVFRRLLSPLDHEDIDAWRHSAGVSMKSVLQADLFTCIVPLPGARPLSSDVHRLTLAEYQSRLAEVDRAFGFTRRQAALQVYHRSLLTAPFRESFRRSAYFNEFLLPLRLFDSAGMCALTSHAGRPVRCELIVNRTSRQAPPFDKRTLAVLRLALPAFAAGASAILRLHGIRADFGRLLDDLDEPILLFDLAGRLLHQTPAATCLLDGPAARELRDQTARVVRSLGDASRQAGEPVARTVRGPSGCHVIRGTYAGEQLLGGAPGILVTIEPPKRPVRFDEERLRERFQLTRQETRVALLLVERMTNAEIAETLCISPHTARHHTERVLGKLGISSRKEVAAVLEPAKRPPGSNA